MRYELDNGVSLSWDEEWKSIDKILNDTKTMKEMKELDSDAINNKGISSVWLMTNAAEAVVDVVVERTSLAKMSGGHDRESKRITIICGSGNNGGDGVACAYMLMDRGYDVRAYLFGRREKMTPDELEMEKRLTERGGNLIDVFKDGNIITDVIKNVKRDVQSCVCCIDALFGVGISREILEPYSTAIEIMNEAPMIISCDIPSGVNGDTGEIMGTSVRADVTVTFSCIKIGLLAETANQSVGELVLVPIGIPD
ncbi:MAG: NAD(P)H-hydrate epimerase [Lachnospiraceae bacterium]|nr:NAD(P)H-hydrate epimerase [Lachnospiraceae bacterium]